jgi:hypothetical protein
LERGHKIAIVGIIVTIIIGIASLWNEISPIFLNVLFIQNIPINQHQAYLGITLFAVVIVLGIFVMQYLLRFYKKKPIEVPPQGIQHDYAVCPKCNYPNLVYPPAKEYKGVVLSKCKDKGLEADHNFPGEVKCRGCHKTFEFYWCKGHFYVFGGKKREYKSKLDPKLWDIDDQNIKDQ